MSDATFNERVSAALKIAAQKSGMIDLDGLKLADTSKVTLEADGTVKGADELMAALKEAKPYLFGKRRARDMSESERAAWWNDHARRFPGGRPPPEPMPTDRQARDMSPAERKAFIDEVARRFG